ncbi:cyclophilin type peptidyl-prolyl cis-trans isomerase/CLD [Lineolata rhizophorae]|uniref:Peptidyl-prolyl cis-trans isomerase-like 2 n=1 Tax=Lineolata rhizophorae TaxID=578093 RepID=A0A6A6NYX3_9PEZI|nr:cyclophilin type peptidyl-prolyl cis-trans isomerase/CLD [Lineolata rhizophorae]
MGKGTDKLYITHSEWASSDAYSASAGAGVGARRDAPTFKRLPFNYCALTLQPFSHPVCTPTGTVFDLEHIAAYLKKHGNVNPVDGGPLKPSELLKLDFTKNEDGEYVDPVTMKPFTDNTHLVALSTSGNVFAWDTVHRLNIKAKNWRDLVSDEEFSRKDIITLQDPQNVVDRDISSFKHWKESDGAEPEGKGSINTAALGSGADLRVLKAKEAVAKSREERAKTNDPNHTLSLQKKAGAQGTGDKPVNVGMRPARAIPANASQHTTGMAAASFTSTGVTPHTSGERALLTDEEYMLRPKRVKMKGYARLVTNLGEVTIELMPEWAPKAVWNFVQLAKKGYYDGISFHRNIKNFMIQGGDPTGSGRGGQSIWNKHFNDEIEGPNTHSARGIVSMANKGKNTNGSQFFITYRALPHLNRKHTIFARAVLSAADPAIGAGVDPAAAARGAETLRRLEAVPTDAKDRPEEECVLSRVLVFVDPFEEFLREKAEGERREKEREEVRRQGGADDERTTWTGKRIRLDGKAEEKEEKEVGWYLKKVLAEKKAKEARGLEEEDEIVGEWDEPVEEPKKKKARTGGGFGNFDNW